MSTFLPNTEGVFHDLPAEVYHNAPGISHTMLKHTEPTIAHLKGYMEEEREEPTPFMIMGTLVHHMILEPTRPLPKLAIKPAGMKFSTTEGKLWRAAKLSEGNLIVEEKDWQIVQGCVASISRDKKCREIFGAPGKSEVSLFSVLNYGISILRKCRMDWIPAGNALVDIKTTQDASREAFMWEIKDRRYYTQGAYYLDIYNALHPQDKKECFVFVAVEKKPPYLVAKFELKPRTIEKGRGRNMENLYRYAEAVSSGVWAGYPDEIQPIGLPEDEPKQNRTAF